MPQEEQSVWTRLREFTENLLALNITDAERLYYAQDPLNVFRDDLSNRRPLRVAMILTLLFHIFIFFIRGAFQLLLIADIPAERTVAELLDIGGGNQF